jgi:hypothetical protein
VDLIKFYVLLWKGVVAADLRIRVMVFNTTFNNISVICGRDVDLKYVLYFKY